MATAFAPILCSAAPSSSRKPDLHRKQAGSTNSNNWWTPIFGWSSEPDYIQSSGTSSSRNEATGAFSGQVENDMGRSRFNKPFRGCFTEEKAKELRRKTIETSNFHDVMYHSAIASRLASDVSDS